MHMPHTPVLLFGVFPMRMWQIMAGICLFELLMVSSKRRAIREGRYMPGGINVSHEAHLGGAAFGLAYFYATAMT